MPARRLVVLSNKTQHEAFFRSHPGAADTRIVCDNAKFYDFLKAGGVAFEALDEFSLKDRWAEINAWACGRAAGWGEAAKQAGFWKEVNFSSVIYMHFSYILAQMLKNYCYANFLLRQFVPSVVTVFESSTKRSYPFFSGNFFLNHFLEQASLQKGVEVERIPLAESETLRSLQPDPTPPYRRRLMAAVKKLLQIFYARIARPRRSDVIVYGALRHVGDLVRELKNRNLCPALYDTEFRFDQWRFAAAIGIPYFVPECFSRKNDAPKVTPGARMAAEASQAFEYCCAKGFFMFDEEDFGPFIHGHIFPGIHGYVESLGAQALQYDKIFQSCEPKALLVDEDFGQRRSFMTAYAKSHGIQNFCLSHATVALDFKVPAESRLFAKSITFVQSEFEKSTYEAKGWKADQIAVTGLPRLDRLVKLSKRLEQTNQSGVKKLLYCAATFWPHDPDQWGYLGCHIECYADMELPVFRRLLEAAQGLPLEIIVKPHSFESVASWRQFLAKERPLASRVTLAPHSADFFDLLIGSDGMILSYWSTALIECAIAYRPAFFLNFRPAISPALENYEAAGLCRIIRDTNRLQAELEAFCEGKNAREAAPDEKRRFYLGWQDGRSVMRVADQVLREIKS